MCGICGIYDYSHIIPQDTQSVQEMLHAIRHRGPDEEGIHIDCDLAFGVRRLSIIDLKTGTQPIYNEDRSLAVIFNGEIYNYRELQQQLKQRGHHLSSASDTEVIVHLYEERGEDCLRELRGMFALAVWDGPRHRLFLARDRLGIKPLYYTLLGKRLVFASEIKALLRHPGVQAQLDHQALSDFLTFKYVPAPRTMFAGILALPPGHSLTCSESGVIVSPYWDLSFAHHKNGHTSEEDYAEQLQALLRDAVRLHLVSDVPFGAFLSGGIDSSAIVALMSGFLDQPVKTFSVGFEGEGEESSELPYARVVAKLYRTDHHEVLVKSEDLANLADKVVWHLDQPIGDQASLANYMVAELASREVKMVLTGEGGDEVFAGYARYVGEQAAPFFNRIPTPIKKMVLDVSAGLPGLLRPKVALFALCQSNEVTRLTNWFALFNSQQKTALLSNEFKETLGCTEADDVFAGQLSKTDARDVLSRMLYVDSKLWLPDDLLARGDKMSMAASIEARVPLLDHKLVEFVASLPPNLKVRGLTRKYLLKKVSKAWLPPLIINRKKQGFPMPMAVWLRHQMRPMTRDLLSPDTLRRRALFHPSYVEGLLNQHEAGFADHSSLLWALINVELWHRLFVDTPTAHS